VVRKVWGAVRGSKQEGKRSRMLAGTSGIGMQLCACSTRPRACMSSIAMRCCHQLGSKVCAHVCAFGERGRTQRAQRGMLRPWPVSLLRERMPLSLFLAFLRDEGGWTAPMPRPCSRFGRRACATQRWSDGARGLVAAWRCGG